MSRKTEIISEAMNGIGDDLIRDAEDNVPVKLKPKHYIGKIIAIAAAVLLTLVAIPVSILILQGGSEKANMAPDVREEDTDLTGAEEPHFTERDTVGYTVKGHGINGYFFGGSYGKVGEALPDGDSPMEEPEGGAPGEDYKGEEAVGPTEPVPEIKPGMLTAAAWDDNLHFAKWLDLFRDDSGQGEGSSSGKFASCVKEWRFPVMKRVAAEVKNGGEPVRNAIVSYYADGSEEPLFTARTDANGKAYLFLPVGANDGSIVTGTGEDRVSIPYTGSDVVFDEAIKEEPENLIELVFVIDVTGSMGDELSYIKRELEDVINTVRDSLEQKPEIRLGFVFYRDDEDEEKLKVLYLNPVAGGEEDYMETYLTELRSVDAFGGGDMPEAVEEAMEEAMKLNWTNESSTKMIFHVFDAPSHSGDPISEKYDVAVRTAAEKGIRICPVISSGADLLAEFQGRAEALLTGGTFVYLTDDSGIGGPHLDPNLPDAVHEYLNALMVRLIKGYYTGTFEEPVAWVKAD